MAEGVDVPYSVVVNHLLCKISLILFVSFGNHLFTWLSNVVSPFYRRSRGSSIVSKMSPSEFDLCF